MAEEPRGGGCLGLGIALVSATAMVGLFVFLAGEQQAGADAIRALRDDVIAGNEISAQVARGEAAALNQALRASTGVSVGNFQAQASTACYAARLTGGPEGTVRAAFLFAVDGDRRALIAASITRGCSCPDPAYEPCTLE